MSDLTPKDVDDWLTELFGAMLKNSVRYFWMDGINYQVQKGKLYAQNSDGNYYECSMLVPKRVVARPIEIEISEGKTYTTSGIISFLKR